MRRRLCMAEVAVGALVDPSASVARPAGTGGETSTVRPDGTLLTAASARRWPEDSTIHIDTLPNGTIFQNTAAPSGFNVATASDPLLTELHLPARRMSAAANAAATKNWDEDITSSGEFGLAGTTPSAKARCYRPTRASPLAAADDTSAAGVNQPQDVRTVK